MGEDAEFSLAKASTYLRIDLDAVTSNVRLLQSMCSKKTEMMIVLKANACGHGSVPIARHLFQHGVCRHFAVATVNEGVALRQAGIEGFILVLGSGTDGIDMMKRFKLTPKVSCLIYLKEWATPSNDEVAEDKRCFPPVVIKVDSGMSRHGCQPSELPAIITSCQNRGIPIHSVMTHFASAWDDHDFTQKQLDLFLDTTQIYRAQGIKVHAANSPAIFNGFGVDLDFVRPAVCIFGLPPAMSDGAVKMTSDLGFRPALRWVAKPLQVKQLSPGRGVGYGLTYRLTHTQTIATFSFGFADGYSRRLSEAGVLTTESGQQCPVVGLVSMDAVTAAVNQGTSVDTSFTVFSDNFTSPNSVTNISRQLGTIPSDVCVALASRLPRIYVTEGHVTHDVS